MHAKNKSVKLLTSISVAWIFCLTYMSLNSRCADRAIKKLLIQMTNYDTKIVNIKLNVVSYTVKHN